MLRRSSLTLRMRGTLAANDGREARGCGAPERSRLTCMSKYEVGASTERGVRGDAGGDELLPLDALLLRKRVETGGRVDP